MPAILGVSDTPCPHRYGDTAALARLLGRGCPVDAADYDGRSLLHVAVHNKQEGIVKQLLEAGADPNIRGRGGGCPLLEAAMEGSTAIQVRFWGRGRWQGGGGGVGVQGWVESGARRSAAGCLLFTQSVVWELNATTTIR